MTGYSTRELDHHWVFLLGVRDMQESIRLEFKLGSFWLVLSEWLLHDLQCSCKYMYSSTRLSLTGFCFGFVFMQVIEFQKRKCCVILELSSNLPRVLEFCTSAIPQAFLDGTDTIPSRLTEVILFILKHMTSAVDEQTILCWNCLSFFSIWICWIFCYLQYIICVFITLLIGRYKCPWSSAAWSCGTRKR